MTIETKDPRDAAAAAVGAVLLVLSLLQAIVFAFGFPAAILFVGFELLIDLFGLIACLRVVKGERGGFGWLLFLALLSVGGRVRTYLTTPSPIGVVSFVEVALWALVLLYCLYRLVTLVLPGNSGNRS